MRVRVEEKRTRHHHHASGQWVLRRDGPQTDGWTSARATKRVIRACPALSPPQGDGVQWHYRDDSVVA